MAQRRSSIEVNPLFCRPGEASERPRFALADDPMLPETAYQVVHDQAMLDGNARLNLATFVGTWMEPTAKALYTEAFDKNMIDKDEYPATAAIENRCWRMLAGLWNAPNPQDSIGTSTIGSSEACMLGGLAMKRRWQHARRDAGKSTDKPNIVMSSAVQVCWEKFANYWDVEARLVPVTEEHQVLDGHNLDSYVDENTIGVVAILGVTYTGMYEPVRKIADALDQIQEKTGLNVPIHVDGASGAFIAPFLTPELEWDFRIDRVHSISTSAHKYGLVYPGLGWVVWRTTDCLPRDLVLDVSYLGGSMPTFALNFSRPGAQVLLQYYNFLRLGRIGYRAVQRSSHEVAMHLANRIGKMPQFQLWTDRPDLPVFAWRMTPGYTKKWDLYDLGNQLRQTGWLVPAYPMPDNLSDVTVQRIVVRNGLSMDLAESLLDNLEAAVSYLDGLDGPLPKEGRNTTTFHH